ncbi:hypothetical protein VOLCADRAFT_106747 [Volvox carteri f. nagariensis]|uniref:Uncharacterized protein n=1 Tax=Volvox carteri f. nagariensis TaxID=3068 RepID=D8U9I0_VOLCA|nr:uncharacterized protein VOLCADRAFT_106747 [Volvox carteri f. nagariensis]EFJ43645.1 hypothetical protein VOLCADRAFT_106747 [Volvox carteri f. nagariensis]|eukprot:XP_002955345.1 hypothetical protein VOLCADRAFT_106747 [Volvox carteri f. nagariensis]
MADDFDDAGGMEEPMDLGEEPALEDFAGEAHEGDGNIDILDNQEQQQQQGGGQRQRITTRYMTKYEKARVLGTRALQISMNAPVMVELSGETDPLEIAMKELREKKVPFTIRRYLPDGSYEDWSISELVVPD